VDLKEIEWKGVDWIDLAQDGEKWRRHENSNKTSGSIKSEEFLYHLRTSSF